MDGKGNSLGERLIETLKGLDLDSAEIRIIPPDGHSYRVMGVVISPSFEAMDEGERQEMVWRRVLETLDQADQDRIEFIYTDSPSERMTATT